MSVCILSIGVIDTMMSVAWFLAAIIYMLAYSTNPMGETVMHWKTVAHVFLRSFFLKSLALFHFPLLTLLLKCKRCAFVAMHVCVCMCMCLCVFVCIVCMHVFVCVYECVCFQLCVRLYCAWRVCEPLPVNIHTFMRVLCTQMQAILWTLLVQRVNELACILPPNKLLTV